MVGNRLRIDGDQTLSTLGERATSWITIRSWLAICHHQVIRHDSMCIRTNHPSASHQRRSRQPAYENDNPRRLSFPALQTIGGGEHSNCAHRTSHGLNASHFEGRERVLIHRNSNLPTHMYGGLRLFTDATRITDGTVADAG
ncbi:MAG: hypothetical protein VX589_05075 [Myxococcota bacterium]|nr:hypothetical protein [Myxococcota bacterium]